MYAYVPGMIILWTVAVKFVTRKAVYYFEQPCQCAHSGFKAARPFFWKVSTTEDSSVLITFEECYVNLTDTYIDFLTPRLSIAEPTLDKTILGNGFFAVTTATGMQYTRNGQFMLDKAGRLVTMAGDPVQGKGGDITINVTDGKEILIETDGSVYLGKDLVDIIKVVEFKNMKDLKPTGRVISLTPALTPERRRRYTASSMDRRNHECQ